MPESLNIVVSLTLGMPYGGFSHWSHFTDAENETWEGEELGGGQGQSTGFQTPSCRPSAGLLIVASVIHTGTCPPQRGGKYLLHSPSFCFEPPALSLQTHPGGTCSLEGLWRPCSNSHC